MPKIRHSDTKGLVQETGSGVTVEQGQITRTISALTNTITTVGRNANTSTDTGITPPAGSRILGWKVEILSVTGNPAGNLEDLGFKGGDVDAMINNQGKSLKYMQSGKGTCEVSSELPLMMATVIGNNLNVSIMRKILMDISNNKAFTDYREDRKLDRPVGSWANELKIVQDSETNWQ